MVIFIVGYMACGKTTFGRALARRLGLDFIDLDFRIEQRHHTTITEIFRTRGQEEFRRMEAAMLREVGEIDNAVIACGGGTPCFHGNMDYMNRAGLTLFLDASVDRIVERLEQNRSKRPLMADKRPEELRAGVEEGLAPRLATYRRAHLTLPSDLLESQSQIDQTLADFFALVRSHLQSGFPKR